MNKKIKKRQSLNFLLHISKIKNCFSYYTSLNVNYMITKGLKFKIILKYEESWVVS